MSEAELRLILSKYWGYDAFRPWQLEAIQSLHRRRDVLAVMSTGSGKSILFQLLPVYLRENGIRSVAIIVSPLLSLMEDQIRSLTAMGVSAGMLGGDKTRENEGKAVKGEFAVLYFTPEKLMNWRHGLEALLQNAQVCCIAVDEW